MASVKVSQAVVAGEEEGILSEYISRQTKQISVHKKRKEEQLQKLHSMCEAKDGQKYDPAFNKPGIRNGLNVAGSFTSIHKSSVEVMQELSDLHKKEADDNYQWLAEQDARAKSQVAARDVRVEEFVDDHRRKHAKSEAYAANVMAAEKRKMDEEAQAVQAKASEVEHMKEFRKEQADKVSEYATSNQGRLAKGKAAWEKKTQETATATETKHTGKWDTATSRRTEQVKEMNKFMSDKKAQKQAEMEKMNSTFTARYAEDRSKRRAVYEKHKKNEDVTQMLEADRERRHSELVKSRAEMRDYMKQRVKKETVKDQQYREFLEAKCARDDKKYLIQENRNKLVASHIRQLGADVTTIRHQLHMQAENAILHANTKALKEPLPELKITIPKVPAPIVFPPKPLMPDADIKIKSRPTLIMDRPPLGGAGRASTAPETAAPDMGDPVAAPAAEKS